MKLNLKKGWITRDFVIAGILFSTVVGLFVFFLAGMGAQYDNSDLVSQSFDDNYNKLEDVSEDVGTMFSSISTGQGLSFVGLFDVAFQSTFTVIQLVFSTIVLAGSLPINMIADFTFIDKKIITFTFTSILAILTTIIIFVWISSISRSKI